MENGEWRMENGGENRTEQNRNEMKVLQCNHCFRFSSIIHYKKEFPISNSRTVTVTLPFSLPFPFLFPLFVTILDIVLVVRDN